MSIEIFPRYSVETRNVFFASNGHERMFGFYSRIPRPSNPFSAGKERRRAFPAYGGPGRYSKDEHTGVSSLFRRSYTAMNKTRGCEYEPLEFFTSRCLDARWTLKILNIIRMTPGKKLFIISSSRHAEYEWTRMIKIWPFYRLFSCSSKYLKVLRTVNNNNNTYLLHE